MLIHIKFFLYSKINHFLNSDFQCTTNTKRCSENPKSPNFKYVYFGKNTPVCCATHLYHILKDSVNALEKNNLEYFAAYGVILGAIRHKGLIPWDTDVDIIINQKNFENAYEILCKELGNKYIIRKERYNNVEKSLIRVYLSEINHLHLDIFMYKDNNDNQLLFISDNILFLKTDIFPFQKIFFYDLHLSVPKDIEKQLQTFYGKDYMHYGYRQWAYNKKKFRITNNKPAKIEI